MPNCRKLLDRAKASPANLRFAEARQLAECFGWQFARQKGDHVVYKRAGSLQLMNFQNVKGKAKSYQVRQLLTAIDELGLEIADEDAEGDDSDA